MKAPFPTISLAGLACAAISIQTAHGDSGGAVENSASGWTVVIPEKYHVAHEARFGQVAEKFLRYLEQGGMPPWEVPNILARYRTIMNAHTISRK